ncbi:MAG TPA: DinB family protein [Gemmatimonadaceae bacterium]|nr:DinB family protein [Gemmatimonadaceae bacterium]
MANHSAELRAQLRRILSWQDAHVGFEKSVEGLASKLRGVRVDGFPHSAWELLEHLRITQHDILDFCVNAKYEEIAWPDAYWPPTPAPPSDEAWDDSVAAFRDDRAALEALAADETIDLFAKIPHGSGQTYIRELLLVADHNAYHLGQLVMLRQQLGAWGAA